ncbi:ribonuclease P protein component [Bacteriovorax sp. Seq25_V]|uniref:ribonuclease P protein component n=1 Tax=Bacteriovorax sp. Seq25_V TaxID=1201288 RepID=UPI00038A3683|nr:ribonuclease P protein component [Bacteriovorax sp. Seq25_V]EQC43582.1 ribonuclease P protein component [Bacteriovorax sp. Seq25_V]
MNKADNGFEKFHRLLSASDFGHLKKNAKYFNTKWLRVYFKKSKLNSVNSRIGITVTKKVGKAHDRNKCKRLIREFYRCSEYKETGIDYLILVSPRLFKQSEDPLKDLQSSLEFSFSKIRL